MPRKRGADTAYGGETSPPTNPHQQKVKDSLFSRIEDGEKSSDTYLVAW